eukprot:7435695-Alexandrium_andersonii.AAC.1
MPKSQDHCEGGRRPDYRNTPSQTLNSTEHARAKDEALEPEDTAASRPPRTTRQNSGRAYGHP